MKKLFFYAFAAFAVLSACQREELAQPVNEYDELNVSIEEMTLTRTYKDEDNRVLWADDDRIVAFMNTTQGVQYKVKSGGKPTASFTKVQSDDLMSGSKIDHVVAYYPYSDMIECEKISKGYTMNIELPARQNYALNSFGNGSLPMASISADNNITFCNVNGAMKLLLKGAVKVTSVKVEGKNNEKLAGPATVTVYADGSKPSISMPSGASSSVLLDCGDGVQLNKSTPTELIISIPPVIFTKGFTVAITDAAGSVYTIDTDKRNEVKRSSLLIMPEFTLNASHRDPMEGDYIDEYGINHGQGVTIDGVMWAPVNCGYHETDYKYGKLYQWGRKYGQGYEGNLYDINCTIAGTYADATVPEIILDSVSLMEGQLKDNENKFYYISSSPFDWCSHQNDNLWNAGTEASPVKTEYDPCPEGWRVPTNTELSGLSKNYSSCTTDENGHTGYWFSGTSSYAASVPQVFIPSAGYRNGLSSISNIRGYDGSYWTSKPSSSKYSDYGKSFYLYFNGYFVSLTTVIERTYGHSVRCVKDASEMIEVSSIAISATSLSLISGQSSDLSATITPSNANHKTPFWYSSDESVAEVDQDGNVTAVGEGTATITAAAGMKSATCEVVVEVIPVGNVTLNQTSLVLPDAFTYVLEAEVAPVDATDQSVTWYSDDDSVAIVDQSGVVTTLSSGVAVITAEAGGVTEQCTIKVIALASPARDYVDEYGVNHGKGTAIGDVVWAPVNCGYHVDDFKYGKLYQWGRKYGQGYFGSFYEGGRFYPDGIYADAVISELMDGPVSISGQDESYSNTFFIVSEEPFDWLSPQNDALWNSGTEKEPRKAEYDPCPDGWRVPTGSELESLIKVYGYMESDEAQNGYHYSGSYTLLENGPKVFLPNAGYNIHPYGEDGQYYGDYREQACYYWSSTVFDNDEAIHHKITYNSSAYYYLRRGQRRLGCSVRCVQE